MPITTSALFCVFLKSIFIHIIQPMSNKYKFAEFTLYLEPVVILNKVSLAVHNLTVTNHMRSGVDVLVQYHVRLKTLRLGTISNVSTSEEGTRPDAGLRGPLPPFSLITSPAPLFPSAGSLRLPCKYYENSCYCASSYDSLFPLCSSLIQWILTFHHTFQSIIILCISHSKNFIQMFAS